MRPSLETDKEAKKKKRNLRRANFHLVKRISLERDEKKKNAGHARSRDTWDECTLAYVFKMPVKTAQQRYAWTKICKNIFCSCLFYTLFFYVCHVDQIVSYQSSRYILPSNYCPWHARFVCSTIHLIPWHANQMKSHMTEKWYLFFILTFV